MATAPSINVIGHAPVFVDNSGNCVIKAAEEDSALVTVNSSGDVTAAGDIAGTGDLTAVGITASGNISGVDVTASGDVSAANVSASGTISGDEVEACGTITAAKAACATGSQAFAIGTTSEGYSIYRLEETVDFAGNLAGYKALTNTIPAGAAVVGIQANIETEVTDGGSGDCIGIGPHASDPDYGGKTTNLTVNQKIATILDWFVTTSATQLDVCGVVNATGALTDGNVTAGTVRVVVTYHLIPELDDV